MPRKISNRYFTSSNLAVKPKQISWLSSRLCDITEWENPDFISTAKEIMGSEQVPEHRKIWEFAATVLALKELGLFNSNSVCLSVAAGCERILFYLANHLAGVVATDIYGDGDFSDLEANSNFLHNQKPFAPYDYKEENLCAAYCNALDLKFPDNLFDFSFCMSSIEHFGSLSNSRKAVSEMSRVTKPGGYVIITTEIAINKFKTDQIFKLDDINKLIKNTNLKLENNFQYALSDRSLEHLCDMRKDDLNILPHINLKAYGSIFTSAILILKKEGSSERFKSDKNRIWQIANNLKQVEPIKFKESLYYKIKRKILFFILRIQEKLI